MIMYAHRIEDRVSGNGVDGKPEYSGNGFALRMQDIRQYNGAARVYFDESGEQVVRGTQFAPIAEMDRRPFNIRRPWEVYQITTDLHVVEPIPNGYKLQIEPHDGEIGFLFTSQVIHSGFTGVVKVTVIATRRAYLDEGIIFARAQLVSDWEHPPALHSEKESSGSEKAAVKKSSGQKKTQTKSKSSSATTKGDENEVSTPVQSGDE